METASKKGQLVYYDFLVISANLKHASERNLNNFNSAFPCARVRVNLAVNRLIWSFWHLYRPIFVFGSILPFEGHL